MVWRHSVRCVLLMLGLLPWSASHALKTDAIKDLRYGVALYEFYQQHYFDALTELFIADARGGIQGHGDDPELVRGGIELSYGMHDDAEAIFKRLLDGANISAENRDLAWFYLGKILYQRRYDQRGITALLRVGDELPEALQDEFKATLANLLIRSDRAAEAEVVLKELSPKSSWAPYGYYNLAVAYHQLDQPEKTVEALNRITQQKIYTPEALYLHDKAQLAKAYTYVSLKKYPEAAAAFKAVTVDGVYYNRALLGFGWSLMYQGQKREALNVWTELEQRPTVDPDVQEALLAIPQVMEQLGAPVEALHAYERNSDRFEAAKEQYAVLNRQVAEGQFFDQLVSDQVAEQMGWFWQSSDLPSNSLSPYLTRLVAQNAFQEGLKNLRDLYFLRRNLSQWKRHSQAFDYMISTRKQAYEERLPNIENANSQQRLEALKKTYVRLSDRVALIESQFDVTALANETELDLLERIGRGEKILDALSGDRREAKYRERLRRVKGALQWQLSQQYPERLWSAKKGIRDIKVVIDQSEQQYVRLNRAIEQAPERFTGYGGRIQRAKSEIDIALVKVESLIDKQKAALKALATAELVQQEQRVDQYLLQSRTAIARLYDQFAEPEAAAKKGASE